MDTDLLKKYLNMNIARESGACYGMLDPTLLNKIVENWFDDTRNYDGRWQFIGSRGVKGRVLDMAAGCGTFVLYGLNQGRDVWGVEPGPWKLDYFRDKIRVSGYLPSHRNRILAAMGEALPFKSGTFDLVTTYQTLEHVADVQRCLDEMLRVLKPGGRLFIRAPDYSSFYEGHYRVVFLPEMPRPLAKLYLKLRGRPLRGLDAINYVTEVQLVRLLEKRPRLTIERVRHANWERKIRQTFPFVAARGWAMKAALFALEFRYALMSLLKRQEKTIELWVTAGDLPEGVCIRCHGASEG